MVHNGGPRSPRDAPGSLEPRQESVLAASPLSKPAATPEFKHVIDVYKHRDQTVTCVCGWHGSSASPDGQPSEWNAHLFAVRGKKR